jgi:hypothetical protein
MSRRSIRKRRHRHAILDGRRYEYASVSVTIADETHVLRGVRHVNYRRPNGDKL